MSYQRERDQFVARVSSEGLPYHIINALLRAATTLNRYAELSCSSEAADRDRVMCPAKRSGKEADCCCDGRATYNVYDHQDVPRHEVREHRLKARMKALLEGVPGWQMDTQGDPRGYVLRVIPPSYAERNAGRDRFNRDTIGVPARESGLRF